MKALLIAAAAASIGWPAMAQERLPPIKPEATWGPFFRLQVFDAYPFPYRCLQPTVCQTTTLPNGR